MCTSIRGPSYREHLLTEGMHKILIRKPGEPNVGSSVPFNMKVMKFKEHVPKGFQLAATVEAVEGCGPPCAIVNPRPGIEIRAQWTGAAGQKESCSLSVGVKRALHCNAKLTFGDRVTAVFDSTAKAATDDLLAVLEILAVLREELPVAQDNAGGGMCEMSRPRNDLEGSSCRAGGSTDDSRDVEGRPYSWYSDSRDFSSYGSPPEETCGSAASGSTAKDEIDEPMADLDRGNTSMADFGRRDSYAPASPLSDSQALPQGGVRGTLSCNKTQGVIGGNGADMGLALADALSEGSVDRASSNANEPLLYDAPFMISNYQGSQSRVASTASCNYGERRTAPQHPEPETRRLCPEDEMEQVQAALRNVDSDSETVYQSNGASFDGEDVGKVGKKVSTPRGWECKKCTFINNDIYFQCGMCRAARPREDYHLRPTRTPVRRYSENVEDAQDLSDFVDEYASSKRAKGRPRHGKKCVGSGYGSGAASEAGGGSSGCPPQESSKGKPVRRWTEQASDSASSEAGGGASDGAILRMFMDWAADSAPSSFTLDTSLLADEALRCVKDTKTPSPIKGNGARVEGGSSSHKRQRLLEDDGSDVESSGASAGASEAEGEGIEYFEGDDYETMELDGYG